MPFLQDKKLKFIIIIMGLFANETLPQTRIDTLSASVLKQLSLEELMNIDITIVSKRSQQLFDTPASVYVIQSEDIKTFRCN